MPKPAAQPKSRITVDLPYELYAAAKTLAETEGRSMASLVVEAVDDKVVGHCCDGSTAEEAIAAPKLS